VLRDVVVGPQFRHQFGQLRNEFGGPARICDAPVEAPFGDDCPDDRRRVV